MPNSSTDPASPSGRIGGALSEEILLGAMIKPVAVLLGVLGLSAWPQGQSLPTFTRTLQLEPTAETSANVSVGDVNGDGHLDLVLIKGRHWPGMSRVLLGDGRGRFSRASDLTDTRYRSYSGNLVDLNGD